MTSIPTALAALATVATAGGIALASGPLPGARTPNGTATVRAGPRPSVAVLRTGPRAGPPPDPARGPTTHADDVPVAPVTSSPGESSGATQGRPRPSDRVPDPRDGFGWPLTGRPTVLRRFVVGPYPWSPGHRGVDLEARTSDVLAAGPGEITFAGAIAGRGVVVVRHPGGVRTTYEPLTPDVAVGQTVTGGARIGTLQATPGHCTPTPCLHWGALVADRYLDPLALLDRARRPPPVLLPLDDGQR